MFLECSFCKNKNSSVNFLRAVRTISLGSSSCVLESSESDVYYPLYNLHFLGAPLLQLHCQTNPIFIRTIDIFRNCWTWFVFESLGVGIYHEVELDLSLFKYISRITHVLLHCPLAGVVVCIVCILFACNWFILFLLFIYYFAAAPERFGKKGEHCAIWLCFCDTI